VVVYRFKTRQVRRGIIWLKWMRSSREWVSCMSCGQLSGDSVTPSLYLSLPHTQTRSGLSFYAWKQLLLSARL